MVTPTVGNNGDWSESLAVTQRREWVSDHFSKIFALVVAYLAFVAIGPCVMKHRRPFQLKTPLFLWNLGLGIFSIITSVMLSKTAIRRFLEMGAYDSYCRVGNIYEGVNGDFLWYFTLSKIVELGDTAFLVLRKRPVSLLHWYHHATILMFTFYQFMYRIGPSQLGMAINSSVHSIMYPYFAAKALGIWLPKWVSMFVTTVQIAQFAFGMFVCWFSVKAVIWNPFEAGLCATTPGVAILQTTICSTYLLLFSHFFIVSYCGSPGKTTGNKNRGRIVGKAGLALENDKTNGPKRERELEHDAELVGGNADKKVLEDCDEACLAEDNSLDLGTSSPVGEVAHGPQPEVLPNCGEGLRKRQIKISVQC